MSDSSKGNRTLLFAAVTAVAVLAVAAGTYFYATSASSESKKSSKINEENQGNKKNVAAGGSSEKGDTVKNSESPTSSKSANITKAVVVEDVESDEEEDEDEDGEVDSEKAIAEAIKALEAEYQHKLSMAKKRMQGNDFKKAAQHFTEAINLAPSIPSASRDLVTLYNNRSAMYEKGGEIEEALMDITVILSMDPKHIKAIVRRGRIHEGQENFKAALNDYVMSMLIERAKNMNPSNGEKIHELCRVVAFAEAKEHLIKIRNCPGRSLPTKAYCRNFLETFPSTHRWISLYKDKGVKCRKELEVLTQQEGLGAEKALEHTLNLAYFDLSNGNFISGFNLVSEAGKACPPDTVSTSLHFSELLSKQAEMHGTELHLRCNLNSAIEAYKVGWTQTQTPILFIYFFYFFLFITLLILLIYRLYNPHSIYIYLVGIEIQPSQLRSESQDGPYPHRTWR